MPASKAEMRKDLLGSDKIGKIYKVSSQRCFVGPRVVPQRGVSRR